MIAGALSRLRRGVGRWASLSRLGRGYRCEAKIRNIGINKQHLLTSRPTSASPARPERRNGLRIIRKRATRNSGGMLISAGRLCARPEPATSAPSRERNARDVARSERS